MGEHRYCSKCGAQMNITANFCAACGKQVVSGGNTAQTRPEDSSVRAAQQHVVLAVPLESRPASAQAEETIQIILGGAARHSGFLGLKVEIFFIVFTNLRIIFAHQTGQMMSENVKRARDEAEQQGKGFFGKWGAQFGANSGKHYWQMPPQQILAEQPTNFAVNREHLRSIRMRQEYSDENSPDTYQMEFDTAAGKHKFKFSSLNMREMKKQIQAIYGNIVR